jgi:hypothetical protein
MRVSWDVGGAGFSLRFWQRAQTDQNLQAEPAAEKYLVLSF